MPREGGGYGEDKPLIGVVSASATDVHRNGQEKLLADVRRPIVTRWREPFRRARSRAGVVFSSGEVGPGFRYSGLRLDGLLDRVSIRLYDRW